MSLLEKFRLQSLFPKSTNVDRSADYRQSLADRSEEGIAVIGLDGTLEFVNGAWASMHGYESREELLGKNIRRFYTKKVAVDVNRFLAQTKLLNWYVATVEQLRSDRSSFTAQLKMAALKDDAGQPCGILLIVADISRVSKMQETIERMTGELDTLKSRLAQLERPITERKEHSKVGVNTSQKQSTAHEKTLPIEELRQLAKMAKQFR